MKEKLNSHNVQGAELQGGVGVLDYAQPLSPGSPEEIAEVNGTLESYSEYPLGAKVANLSSSGQLTSGWIVMGISKSSRLTEPLIKITKDGKSKYLTEEQLKQDQESFRIYETARPQQEQVNQRIISQPRQPDPEVLKKKIVEIVDERKAEQIALEIEKRKQRIEAIQSASSPEKLKAALKRWGGLCGSKNMDGSIDHLCKVATEVDNIHTSAGFQQQWRDIFDEEETYSNLSPEEQEEKTLFKNKLEQLLVNEQEKRPLWKKAQLLFKRDYKSPWEG